MVAVVLAGCGGGGVATTSGGPRTASGHDQQLVRSVEAEFGGLLEKAQPLLACDFGSPCKRTALLHLRNQARVVSARIAGQAAGAEGRCPRSAITPLAGSLRDLGSYAQAALVHSRSAELTDLHRSEELRFKAIKRLVACHYLKPGRTIGLEVALVYQQVGRAANEIRYCKVRSCFQRTGRAIKQAADQGLARIGTPKGSLPAACLTLLATVRRYIMTFSQYGAAAEKVDSNLMQSLAHRAIRFEPEIGREVANCSRQSH